MVLSTQIVSVKFVNNNNPFFPLPKDNSLLFSVSSPHTLSVQNYSLCIDMRASIATLIDLVNVDMYNLWLPVVHNLERKIRSKVLGKRKTQRSKEYIHHTRN